MAMVSKKLLTEGARCYERALSACHEKAFMSNISIFKHGMIERERTALRPLSLWKLHNIFTLAADN